MRRHLPWVWLAGLSLLLLLDGQFSPPNQPSARVYVLMVRQYQRFVRPVLRGHVACRFRPTCSEYSVAAVERNGTWRGLRLTVDRLTRCRTDVPLGTRDDVP